VIVDGGKSSRLQFVRQRSSCDTAPAFNGPNSMAQCVDDCPKHAAPAARASLYAILWPTEQTELADRDTARLWNVDGRRRYSRQHHKGKDSAVLPDVIDVFQRAPDRFASGERPRSVVEDLIDELKWRNS